MKNSKPYLLLFLGAIFTLGACNKGNDNFSKDQARMDSIENARVEKIIAEQAPLLDAYVHNPANGWEHPLFSEKTGIWYEVLADGDQDSYTYKLNSNGSLVAPIIEVSYKGELLDGTVFDETDPNDPNHKTLRMNLGQTPVINAWYYALFPRTISYNGLTNAFNGLTETGLKIGSKIRFVTPSPWGYDTQASGKIPANAPLVFEIELIHIEDQ